MTQNVRSSIMTFNPLHWAIGFAVILIVAVLIWRGTGGNDRSEMAAMPGASPDRGTLMGKPAPGFALESVDGSRIALADYKGKVVLVNFWATWCGPCKVEIPDFIELRKELGGRGFEILAISLDRTPGDVREFLRTTPMNFPVLYGTSQVTENYGGVTSIPTTFIVDREGVIRNSFVGSQPKELWESVLKAYL